jgi:SAM-dependent methyltransferase
VNGILAFAPEVAKTLGGYDASMFEVLVALEERSFWFQSRNRLLQWAFTRSFGGSTRHLLEIGVGTGFVLSGLREANPGLQVAGSDIFVEGLTRAAGRLGPSVPLYQMDARQLPFREEFEVVCAFDVLEHIEDDNAVLREMRAALRPGGGIMVTVPQHMSLWGPADEAAHHVRRYERHQMLTRIRKAGFHVTLTTSFVSLLYPALVIARRRTSRAGAYDLAGEHTLTPALSALCRMVMDVERMAIRAGVRFSVGGSLLVVAVRRD